MRPLLLVLVATAAMCSAASYALATCPQNGGAVCNVPGTVSQVAATEYLVNAANPSGPDDYQVMTHVVWTDDRNTATSGSDLYMNSYIDCPYSAVETGDPVVTAPGDQTSPVIVQSGKREGFFGPGNFGVIVAWVDRRGTGADIYARRFLAGAFAPPTPWDSGEIPICDAAGDQTSPAMVAAERGGAILGWIDGRGASLDAYAQRVDSAGIGLWGTNGVPVCSASGDQELLAAVADGAGGAYFCWVDHRSGNSIYATRFTRDGVPASGWNADGNLVADGVQLLGAPAMFADGGGIAVSWNELRDDPDGDVLAQRLGPDGSAVAGWPAGGRAIAAGIDGQRMDDFVSDGAGGCYVVWEREPAGGGDVDLYASRLDAAGDAVAGWPAAVSFTSGRQDHARACVTSGLYVIFSDDRSGNRDLYATRLLPDGTLAPGLWVPNGTVISDAADVQDFPLIVPWFGGTSAVWIDYRDRATNGADLYTRTLNTRGSVDVALPTTPHLSLGAPRPNPARAGASVSLELTEEGRVDVELLDCAGRHVRTVVSGTLAAGHHDAVWDGRTERGAMGAPGVYFVRAVVGGDYLQRPLVVIR